MHICAFKAIWAADGSDGYLTASGAIFHRRSLNATVLNWWSGFMTHRNCASFRRPSRVASRFGVQCPNDWGQAVPRVFSGAFPLRLTGDSRHNMSDIAYTARWFMIWYAGQASTTSYGIDHNRRNSLTLRQRNQKCAVCPWIARSGGGQVLWSRTLVYFELFGALAFRKCTLIDRISPRVFLSSIDCYFKAFTVESSIKSNK